MKNIKPLFVAALFAASTQFIACKGNNKDKTVTDTVVTHTDTVPVTVTPDEELTTKATDATKDYPGVTASVSNGEITLTGTIDRAKLPNLMMGLNALQAKKINNKLTINN